jgi:hypothetical protein
MWGVEAAMTSKDDEWGPIVDLTEAGHTYHCASRMQWGDGECTCPGDGTGSPYHTMHPPPEGWKLPDGATAESLKVAHRLKRIKRQRGLTMGDIADVCGVTVVVVSRVLHGLPCSEGREILKTMEDSDA